ncbi:hypothetical protein RDABS01_015956 [Bienertia sinuspersici]
MCYYARLLVHSRRGLKIFRLPNKLVF